MVIGGVTLPVLLTVEGAPAGGAGIRVSAPSQARFDAGIVVLNGPGGRSVLGLSAPATSAIADDAGFALLENAPPGPAQAALYYNGMSYFLPVQVPAEPAGAQTWNFAGISLHGKVVYSNGAPASGALLSVQYMGLGAQPGQAIRADEDGAFKVSGLGTGSVVLMAKDDHGRTGSATVAITLDQPPPALSILLTSDH